MTEYLPSRYSHRLPSEKLLAQFLTTLKEKSKTTAETYRIVENVPYGDTRGQIANICYPDKVESETEVVFFFHGGYWQEGSPALYTLVAYPVVKAGKICVIVGKDLAPKVNITALVDECRKAISYFAQIFPLASKITLVGHSSGGHETAMLLATDWLSYNPDTASYLERTLRKVVLVCGIFQLEHLLGTEDNKVLQMTAEEARENSPILAPNLKVLAKNVNTWGCEVVMVIAQHDAPTILHWNDVFMEELKSSGVKVTHKFLNGVDHFSVIEDITEESSALAQIISQ
ncbi:kynurenine formamidase-like isoform X2 [Ciona intestinalis]